MDFTTNTINEYEETTLYIKESRKTRKDKIEKKQEYHKKHPKSVEYYKALALDPIDTPNVINSIDSINIVLKEPIMQTTDKPARARTKNKSPTSLSIKQKNYLQQVCQSLAKSLKRENIFLDYTPQYNSLIAMKDYNISVIIGDEKIPVSVRAVVGEYKDFKHMMLDENATISTLKQEYQKWFRHASLAFNPQEQVQHALNLLFSKYQVVAEFTKYLPKLEAKVITTLKKPTKQPEGYAKKLEQLDMNWLEEVEEILNIETIESELNLSSYEQSFTLARNIKRKFTILVGPTNSGKTYTAMNELSKAKTGVYLAPLRLMAHEGQESLFERGILSDVITGEERKIYPGATHISSTVEMCNMEKIIDCAVIDEIQMIANDSRGWAWSQALIGVPARHIVLVGSAEALPHILPIIEHLGEEYSIQEFERKVPLHTHDGISRLKDLKKSDCVIVFSRKQALEMKNVIEATGKKCSIIYGNLSPEVRRVEADKFKKGEKPILIATDAIGMGLNLPINRLFFSTMEKFDGVETRKLSNTEIKQIAGRAGRFGFAEVGEVGLLMNDSYEDKQLLTNAIYGEYDKTYDTRISIAPNLKQIQTICKTIGKQELYSALIFFKEKLIRDHRLYKAANLDAMIEIASMIKNKNLDLATGLNYVCVPIDTNSELHKNTFFRWINNHIAGKNNLSLNLPSVIEENKSDSYSLYEAENYVKLCMSYRWLYYRYADIYPDIDNVTKNAHITNQYIERTLHHHVEIAKNPRWKR